jgi:hypothetical protein
LAPLRERDAFQQYLAPVRKAEWVVYAKRPFAGPEQVLDYVGRYTHRVAISNNRILDVEDGKVRFRWKDYRHGNQQKTMTLSADEFIRRFLIHVLPSGFQHIRYYGFLGNRYREEKLAHCRELGQMPGLVDVESLRPGSAFLRSKSRDQSFQRCAADHLIIWDQGIGPWFSAILDRMAISGLAPLHGCLRFCLDGCVG